VIKGVPGAKPPIAEHKHTELDFLFVYVLKGWMSFHYHGTASTGCRPATATSSRRGCRTR
jgi:hypothetical protein